MKFISINAILAMVSLFLCLSCFQSHYALYAQTLPGDTPAENEEGIQPDAMMLQYPDVGKEKIVFLFANDLWIVDRSGGQAVPLASPPGAERFARFSPDGKRIAFMGNYDGDRELYTIPAAGGVPHRVTHHPATETLCDWTPDGKIIFYAYGLSGLGMTSKLYTVDPSGGLPEALPVPYGADGAISPDGTWLCYAPHSRNTRTWKRYRGGMATDLWLFNLKTFESKRITDWEGTDTLPMWHGDKIYYLSDRSEGSRLNLWSYDTTSDDHAQVTDYRAFDVKWPSIGPGDEGQGEIIYQNGPGLYLLDLAQGAAREVKITIPGALPTVRPKQVDASDNLQAAHISATGKRAVVQARGDLWTLPAEHGSPRNLTSTSGTAERMPAWSPDGRWVAYFSDATGEYELYITQSDGKGETRQLTEGSETFYYLPEWSPDSKHILFTCKSSKLFLYSMESKETRVVDEDPWADLIFANWSHDSRWLTYSRQCDDRPVSAIWVYNLETGERKQVTSGMFSDSAPVFDRKGDYLFFASNRSFSPTYSDVDSTFIYNDSGVLLAVPLLEEVKSPWLPESDEETWEEEDEAKEEEAKEKDEAGEEGAEEASEEDEDPVTGTWEGTASTEDGEMSFTIMVELENGEQVTGSFTSAQFSGEVEGTYDASDGSLSLKLTADVGLVIFINGTVDGDSFSGTATAEGDSSPVEATRISRSIEEKDKDKVREKVEIDFAGFERRAMKLPLPRGRYGNLAVNDRNQLLYIRRGEGIKLFDMKDDKKEEKTIDAAASQFYISGDGKKMLVLKGEEGFIRNSSPGGKVKKVITEGMTQRVNPREEWRQVFVDAWRLQRDYFYVDNLHGVDWPAVRKRYEPMLKSCFTREDVSYVIREMISELNVGHAYYYGGDVEDEPSMNVGLLGVDFSLENGAYRIATIHEGAVWDVDARNPLKEAGIDVKAGDYLLAVNGAPLDTSLDPWSAFVGLAKQTVTITVSDKPTFDDDAREVIIEPLSSDGRLRYRAFIERNRAYVDEKTGGRVGYIYVPDTGVNGQNNLVRQYFGQVHKDALIIDERWNGGGQIPSRFIEMLNRPVTNYWARRHGKDVPTPGDAHQGPKCMLINGLAGSGGDMFPWLFRKAGLGKLIGTRTWGGLVGISGNPGLIDGGRTTVPTFGFYEIDGTWGVEGHGVDPDMEVIDDPAKMRDGGDPQLDFAIEHMLKEIETRAFVPPKRPAPPDRSGMGIKEEDI
ncbi:MAG: S41 family peptidase [Planctomycetota bacterium]|jgi:tricorn protease